MKWISLKKQEAPLNELVLLSNIDSKNIEDHWVVAGERIGKNSYCNQFVNDDIIKPTHWRPLPKPPKKLYGTDGWTTSKITRNPKTGEVKVKIITKKL